MAVTIDYYFVTISPYAYLGHQAFHDLAEKYNVQINYKPFSLSGVWEKSGSIPLGQRSPARQRYRRIELQRFREHRNLPLNLDPKFFPVDFALADRCAAALVASGADCKGFVLRAHQGVWANEENISDPEQLAAYLTVEGHDADAVLSKAQSDEIGDIITRNTQEAIAMDAIGAPIYALNGEAFWGQDRLDYLELALKTGRAPYQP